MSFPFGLSRWKPRRLLAAWSAYWAGLVLVTLGPAIVNILRVAVPAGAKGSVSAGFGDAGTYLTVTRGPATVWSGTASIASIALWIAGPPLLLWLAWLAARPARPTNAPLEASSQRMLNGEPFSLYDREKPVRESVDRD